MKNNKHIKTEIQKIESELSELKIKHNNLGQIDMLSQEGSSLREQINIKKGKIEALYWVITST